MPRKNWINKSTATTFQLVHRPQNDPLNHDESSESMVFRPLVPSQAHKIKSRGDLESETFARSPDLSIAGRDKIRDNEGQAAEQGIYFDDTGYDYMQHIRDLGSENWNGESFFVEAKADKNHGKGRHKISIEDALRESSLQDDQSQIGASSAVSSILVSEALSSNILQRDVEAQQEVPDVLAGFQPDMDPRLREVLEALNDDAYIDEEEDMFEEIAKDRREVSLGEFEDTLYDHVEEDEDGWESDVTEKPRHEYKDSDMSVEPLSELDLSMLKAPLSDVPDVPDMLMNDTYEPDHGYASWMKEFSKFKKDQKSTKPKLNTPALNADIQSSILTGHSMTSGRKRRKGALTSSTAFSMTSSSLARTEGLTTLDRRFDKIEEEYAEDEDDESMLEDKASVTTKSSVASKNSMASGTSSLAPNSAREDFDHIMDEFLGGYQIKGKRVKKGRYQSGMEQLSEVRKELGPARVDGKKFFPSNEHFSALA